jgi:hypothetical protein
MLTTTTTIIIIISIPQSRQHPSKKNHNPAGHFSIPKTEKHSKPIVSVLMEQLLVILKN